MTPFQTYLANLREIRSTGAGVKETSYYPALSHLLDEVGKSLKPRVRCVMNLANRGAGMPDGGLFTADQFQRSNQEDPLAGASPSRGVIEVKGTGDDVKKIAASPQVAKYWDKYRLVLVTNYRDFVLIGQANSQPVTLETFQLAKDETAFWQNVQNPATFAEALEERFTEYLKRVMLHAAPLSDPKDVAWFLASYARDAKTRIDTADSKALNTLEQIRIALEESLGIQFQDEDGKRFFQSTLVQTLFYGIFSAWVLWCKERAPSDSEHFSWKEAAYSLHVPVIQILFEQLSAPSKVKSLNLLEVLDWTGAALNRVDRKAFFERFQEGEAVQYFYEPFLAAFDPQLRKDLGVWYTPIEVVQYMVERIDTVLREELNISDGFANPNVVVLDPCCGTGAYLVAVLRRIHRTLQENGGDALSALDLKRAAIDRIFGFEILPAPFVVAHLQIGLFLQNLGIPLEDESERAGIYLTNALTGWEPATDPKTLLFPEFEQERDAADKVKQKAPILVILGNPPYNSFAGRARMEEERDLSASYRTTIKAAKPQGQGLNDLYVRFFRMAERKIVEQSGQGIVCFISNYSWLEKLSFTGMRERYLSAFDKIWIDCLNGDKFKTGKLTPDGHPDPSIFSTEWNREGIQVGISIALLVRQKTHTQPAHVHLRNFWGKEKSGELIKSLTQDFNDLYTTIHPVLELGLPISPAQVKVEYLTWPLLPELFPASFPGIKTSRDDVVVDIDRDILVKRMEQYFDPQIGHEQMARISPSAVENASRFEGIKVREYLWKRGFLPNNIIPYCYRPFDLRWLYWEPQTKLLDEKRSEYFPHVFPENVWIAASQQQRREFDPPIVSSSHCSLHVIERGASLFPFLLRQSQDGLLPGIEDEETKPNISDLAKRYLSNFSEYTPAKNLFLHVAAIVYSPEYRHENASALQKDWPRIPLPISSEAINISANLGRQIASLLDTQVPVLGVTQNPIRLELRKLAEFTAPGGILLSLTAGWGHRGKGGITMPGKGKTVERSFTIEELQAIEQGVSLMGLSLVDALDCLGQSTFDVYLNDTTYWKNIPANVWGYTIGGYQVIKKWLSYREKPLLCRDLKREEVREIQGMTRRIAAIVLLGAQLDANYQHMKSIVM
jgi:Type ISP C-terminal specificity domain/N-6 DNA Methylase